MTSGDKRQGEWKDILLFPEQQGVSALEIEKKRIRAGSIPQHYARNLNAVSPEEQLRLLDARVGICGCGGLGLYIVNHLARLGVGHISIWDPDVFSETNLNRQLWCTYSNLGQSKVEVCAQFVRDINPAVSVNALPLRWEESEPLQFGQLQVMVDALDNIPSRLALARLCESLDIPMVHGAVGGWYGQITVIMPGDKVLQNLYGISDAQGIEKDQGTLSFAAALIASLQAAETVKLLLDRESVLQKQICMIDLLDLSMELLEKNVTIT